MTESKTTTYRAISTMTIEFDNTKITTTTVCQGSDITAFSRKYPPSDMLFADLIDHSEIAVAFISTDYRFERQLEDGSWEKCNDPRRRITPKVARERGMDAQNSRDPLGDSTSYDCDCCDDEGCELCGDEALSQDRYNDRDHLLAVMPLGVKCLCSVCQSNRIEQANFYCSSCNISPVDIMGDICVTCQAWLASFFS